MHVTVLVDESGSMSGFMDDVRTAADDLIDDLPDHVLCRVIAFSSKTRDLAIRQNPTCSVHSFDLASLDANGGTNLFQALGLAYDALNDTRFSNHQKVVLVLTDGSPGDTSHAQKVLRKKRGVQKLFFWLGSRSSVAETLFAPFADAFVVDAQKAANHVHDGFSAIAKTVGTQTVVTVKPETHEPSIAATNSE